MTVEGSGRMLAESGFSRHFRIIDQKGVSEHGKGQVRDVTYFSLEKFDS